MLVWGSLPACSAPIQDSPPLSPHCVELVSIGAVWSLWMSTMHRQPVGSAVRSYVPLLGSSGGITLTAECWIGERNLNRWLVESGWALTVSDTESVYHADERLAQRNNLGLWRGGFIPPDTWRPAGLGENAACGVCSAKCTFSQRLVV